MRVRIRHGTFEGLVGEATPAFGRGRFFVRFGRSVGTVLAGVDYLFTRDEIEPVERG